METSLAHIWDDCNPQMGFVLRQSNAMPKTKPLEKVLSENLASLMSAHELLNTVEAVSKRSGVSRGTVDRVKKAEVSTSLENVKKLADAFNVDPAALLTTGMHAAAATPSDAVELKQYREVGGSMGTGLVLRDQPGEIQSWRVTPEWVQKNVPHHTGIKNLCIVTGFGPSMRPLFNPGDPLLVDRGVVKADRDAIYFFRVGDEGFIKHLQRVPGQGLVAISENKIYRDWVITQDMDFEVFGLVLKVWKGEDF